MHFGGTTWYFQIVTLCALTEPNQQPAYKAHIKYLKSIHPARMTKNLGPWLNFDEYKDKQLDKVATV